MKLRSIEAVAQNTNKTWYVGLMEIAKILGVHKSTAREFVNRVALPCYYISKRRAYFLPDVLEAVERSHAPAGGHP